MLFTQGDIFSHLLWSEQENYSNWIFSQSINISKHIDHHHYQTLFTVAVTEISSHFIYSVGLTAENNKKTDKKPRVIWDMLQTFMYSSVADSKSPSLHHLFPCCHDTTSGKVTPCLLLWLWGAPIPYKKEVSWPKAPVGLCSKVSLQGYAHTKKHPVTTALALGV